MARKLKTYQTSLGFFDLAMAAPSMKAALEAWGADSNLFHHGAAKESFRVFSDIDLFLYCQASSTLMPRYRIALSVLVCLSRSSTTRVARPPVDQWGF
jgi:hypothetical protein